MAKLITEIETGDLSGAGALALVYQTLAQHATGVENLNDPSLSNDSLKQTAVQDSAQDVPESPAPVVEITTADTVAETIADITSDGPVELDANGIPWDERIHASTRSTLKNGTWKLKRGVDEALVKQVESELLGEDVPAVSDAVAPPPPQAATPAPAPAETEAEDVPATFSEFIAAYMSKGFTNDQIAVAVQKAGLETVTALNSDPSKIAEVWGHLNG